MNIQTPAARNTDPETSHMAIEAITKSGKRMIDQEKVIEVMAIAELNGGIPMTGGEIAKKLTDRHPGEKWDNTKAIKRLCDLKGVNVNQLDKRKCGVLGSMCMTWELIGGSSE